MCNFNEVGTQMKDFYSFDGTEKVCADIDFAKNRLELENLIGKGKFIPRGSGLSYCGASLSHKSTIISGTLMNSILCLDENNLSLTVESGITIGEVLQFLREKKLWLPVVPGHPSITIGGCVAFNVHGKNQYKLGNFKEHIEELVLYHPEYGYTTCSPNINKKQFDLSIGGAGLTGFIISVKLKLYKPKSYSIQRQKVFVSNIELLPIILKEHCDNACQIFSWHNLNSTGEGFVFIDNYLDDDIYTEVKENSLNGGNLVFAQNRRKSILQYLYPVINFNHLNLGISTLQKFYKNNKVISLYESNFPLASAGCYYKLFGKRGFREYQCIVPSEIWPAFIKNLKKLLKEHNVTITLASAKYFKGEKKFLNFCGNGICLTLNMPNDSKSMEMLKKLDAAAIHYHAIVNISKDSRLQSATAKKFFSEYDDFKHELSLYDSNRFVNSLLRERLDV